MANKKLSSMNIEIAVSTIDDGIYNIHLNDEFNYLIVHQVTHGISATKYDDVIKTLSLKGVRYFRLNGKGLSISRNVALDNANADYIWIMDDDVTIKNGSLSKIEEALHKYDPDVLVLDHDSNNKDRRAFREGQVINKITAMSVCSIDLLIKVSSLHGVRFPTELGLGTDYPSGEEYVFCCDLLKRKQKIVKTNISVAIHPQHTSGQDFYSNMNKFLAKKKMFNHVYGRMLGAFFYWAFLVKKTPILINKKSAIKMALLSLFKN